jgi:hypothetical protein
LCSLALFIWQVAAISVAALHYQLEVSLYESLALGIKAFFHLLDEVREKHFVIWSLSLVL